ncbi:MAG: hypothetical protein P9L89_06790 [Candidatus Celaenobacter polaris]|nr:hypothetical protein [Candidatus Celaenobacter polaris]
MINHEIHPDTVVPPYRAGEKYEINKITLDRKFLNSRSKSPDWKCIIVETHFCVPKVGFGNEIKGVCFRNEIKGMCLGAR